MIPEQEKIQSKTKRTVRNEHEGNDIWKHYLFLNFPEKRKFKEWLLLNSINYQTFYKDSRREKKIASINNKRVTVYTEFFQQFDKTFNIQAKICKPLVLSPDGE